MLIDSEDSVSDPEQTWAHLASRDGWTRPAGADDEQVLFMTTCMETWIAADRDTLRAHYGPRLQENALPPLEGLEQRNRHDVHGGLAHATRNCSNAYAKGKRSFEVVGKLDPTALARLPAFARVLRILGQKLKPGGPEKKR